MVGRMWYNTTKALLIILTVLSKHAAILGKKDWSAKLFLFVLNIWALNSYLVWMISNRNQNVGRRYLHLLFLFERVVIFSHETSHFVSSWPTSLEVFSSSSHRVLYDERSDSSNEGEREQFLQEPSAIYVIWESRWKCEASNTDDLRARSIWSAILYDYYIYIYIIICNICDILFHKYACISERHTCFASFFDNLNLSNFCNGIKIIFTLIFYQKGLTEAKILDLRYLCDYFQSFYYHTLVQTVPLELAH